MEILIGPNSGTRVMQRLRLAIIAGDRRNDHNLLCCLTAIFCDPIQDVQCCTKLGKLVSSAGSAHFAFASSPIYCPSLWVSVASLDVLMYWVAKVVHLCNTNPLEV